jgi:glyoxylase-like metal-dependent hydrolase (beta-lactamase superfamily II)
MLTWTVGTVTISSVIDTEAALPCEVLYPGSDPAELAGLPWVAPFLGADGLIRLAIQSFLVRTPGRRIVVDLCAGNAKARAFPGFSMLKTDYLERLAAADFEPASVDTVICTHLHGDHVGWGTRLEAGAWVPTFPNARHLIDRAELEFWAAQQDSPDDRQAFDDSIRPLLDAGLVDPVTGEHRVTDEVVMLATPGHTPGHRSVRIRSQDARALITGDLMHNACQVGRPDWACFIDHDPHAATQSRKAALADAATNDCLVIGTHFPPPTAGRVIREGDGYRFET